jgi:hypothetical protein
LLASLAPATVSISVSARRRAAFRSRPALCRLPSIPPESRTFAEQLSDINTYLAADPSLMKGRMQPRFRRRRPERFLLGASVDSAELAAAKRWRLVFAGQLNGDPENLHKTLEAYAHASGGKTPILALAAYAAEDANAVRAKLLAICVSSRFSSPTAGASMSAPRSRPPNTHARADVGIERLEAKAPSVLHGTAAEVRR